MKRLTPYLPLLLVFFIACQTNQEKETIALTYPETTKSDHVDTYHGTAVPDPYQWLEDDLSAETGSWVQAQNDVTGAYFSRVGFRDALKGRIEELLDYEKISAPFKEGDYEYFYKNDGLQNHSVLYRTKLSATEGAPEVFLDPNSFSDDGTIGLRGVFFTKDASLAAYMIT